jgi:hypothetical protein
MSAYRIKLFGIVFLVTLAATTAYFSIICKYLFNQFSLTLLAFLAGIYIDKLRDPKLTIYISEVIRNENLSNDHRKDIVGWFYQIAILNSMGMLGFPRSIAHSCYGFLDFYSLGGNKLPINRIKLRWANTEPSRIISIDGDEVKRAVEKRDIDAVLYTDLRPGEPEPADIIARFNDERDSYAWDNESHIGDRKSPSKKIEPGIYLCQIRIFYSGRVLEKILRLYVGETQQDTFLQESFEFDQLIIKSKNTALMPNVKVYQESPYTRNKPS